MKRVFTNEGIVIHHRSTRLCTALIYGPNSFRDVYDYSRLERDTGKKQKLFFFFLLYVCLRTNHI